MTSETASVFAGFDPKRVPSPCHVIELATLEENLRRLKHIADSAEVKLLLALKAFSCFAVADLVGAYLQGTAASGLWEARLGRERFSGEVHAYLPGLKEAQLREIEGYADHLIFNSVGQWERFHPLLEARPPTAYGLRVNPRHSEVTTPRYDPCAAWSRLGALASDLNDTLLASLGGLHVHGLCDQGFDPFDRLLAATEARFGEFFGALDWINLGGGQLLTADDYPMARLVARLRAFKERWGLEVYLEPGTAVALNAGALVTEVLDLGRNEGRFAVLDASATCHMPDVLEAPYTPDLLGATSLTEAAAADDPDAVRLGGPTCLAGDVIGCYRFTSAPEVGQRLVILDQAYYTMVKATTFNGTPLPALALWDSRSDALRMVREFGYDAFESRLS
ncbi:MAG TPA: carboxynorspermidine decarboxylase [Kiloniellaceae bacterium]|nr:carboxynorspermidine decarboxylase [Kiloniellaceae bacterium]